MTILDQIAEKTRARVEALKAADSPESIRRQAMEAEKQERNVFYEAVASEGVRLICEVKKASPSKGVIDPEFDYLRIAADYEAAGGDCISCLTEPYWFLGTEDIFRDIRSQARLPMLQKDFVVDDYQIYRAKVLGADCVLLIAALMNTKTLAERLEICERLGLAALVETHDEDEIASALSAGARMIGVNSRNLKDFSVDLTQALRLRDRIPPGVLYVSESGVRTPEDAAVIRRAGADAILIGEALMRAQDRLAALQALKEAVT